MENIERTQFMVLTGHLDDQPLPDLIRTLRVQRKSGRLQVEYADTPGAFFFEEGQLVDAQLGSLRGLEALYAALALDGASFNFNPLVRPPERSIDRQQQKFINDLVETPRRENLVEIDTAGRSYHTKSFSDVPSQAAPLQLAPVAAELIAPLEERLTAVEAAINATSRRFSRERLIYAIVISFLVGLMVVTALQAFMNLRQQPAPATAAATRAATSAATSPATNLATSAASSTANAAVPSKNESGTSSAEREGGTAQAPGEAKKAGKPTVATKQTAQTLKVATAERDARKGQAESSGEASKDSVQFIRVLLDVKNGEVTNARVLNPRSGAAAHKAQALKQARSRRYPNAFTGSETVMVRVKL